MDILLKNGLVYGNNTLEPLDVLIEDGMVMAVQAGLVAEGTEVYDATGCVIAPGFCDLHVHLREPGFTDKETIATGTAAAAAGGFTTVCSMPNLMPVPDERGTLYPQLEAIERDARVRVRPYATLTTGQLGDRPAAIKALAPLVVGFSDDGLGVQSEAVMLDCMHRVAAENSFVAAHCEVNALLPPPGTGTCVQEGSAFAAAHGFAGHSNKSEAVEVARDIRLAAEANCHLHICHASAAESFAAVREAKKQGQRVTCEVTPHNLLLSCDDIKEDDGRFKMNPPLRTPKDRDAALRALLDGTVDAVATDHAPHTAEEKAGGFACALNGVVGLETAFPVLYSRLVKPGTLPLERLLEVFTKGPRQVIGEHRRPIDPHRKADLVVLDLETIRTVEPDRFLTKGRATPFTGWRLSGWPVLTFCDGQLVYRR